MSGTEGLAVASTAGRDFHDPAGADADLDAVLQRLSRPQCPGDAAAVADLVIVCHERDVMLTLKLMRI